MPTDRPAIVLLGGPNGAGKSTAASRLLRGRLRVDEFVNADTLAQGLSAFRPQNAAIEAGRIMLSRLEQLQRQRQRFAFESTLASLSIARRLARARTAGYRIHVVFLWLPDVELAVSRVAERVRSGGHDVPEEAIRRRFWRGRLNFFTRYRLLADTWRLYDASPIAGPAPIASGGARRDLRIRDASVWREAVRGYGDE